MTNDPLESRPTADGELREQIKQLAVYKAATNFHEQYRPDKSNLARFQANWIDGVLNLIKQNSPQGGVSSPAVVNVTHDSSIPDDDSLQSQPQLGQDWQHDWIDAAYDDYIQSLPDADKRAEYQAPLKLKAAIQSHIQQLQQQHEAEVLEARIDTAQFAQNGIRDALVPVSDVRKLVRVRVVDEMLDKFIEELESQLARLKQQQQERGTGGEEPHEPK